MNRYHFTALPNEFASQWAAWYPDAPPIGFILRDAYPERWLRVHSSPTSRRVPVSGWDYAELMRRHNAVANEILEPGGPCALVIFEKCSERDKCCVLIGNEEIELQKMGPIDPQYWDADDGAFAHPTCLFGATMKWNTGEFDGLIGAAGRDEIKPLLVSLATGRAYAPYDGGADLFFLNSLERDLASEKFHNWLSSRSDGL